MDYYPQPRPVLYGASGEDTPPQTQTAPVRIGPPRYPPAPPLAGDAPDPFDGLPASIMNDYANDHRWGAIPLAILYAIASIYSLLPIMLGTTGFGNVIAGQIVLSVEIVIALVVLASLVWLGGRDYILALALVLLHVAMGILFSQWQSPAFWVAIAIMLYLLRPSMRKHYWRMALSEIRSDVARYRCRHPHRPHSLRRVSRSHSDDWRVRW